MLRVTNLVGFGARRLVAAAAVPVVWNSADKTASITLSNGDRTATSSATGQGVRGNIGKSTGKWYFELKQGSNPWSVGGDRPFGIAQSSYTMGDFNLGAGDGLTVGVQTNFNNFIYNSSTVSVDPQPADFLLTGDVLMVAFDATGGKIWFGCNNAWGGVGGVTGDPGAGTTPAISGIASATWYPIAQRGDSGDIIDICASAVHCTYALPSGFSYWAA